MRVRILRSHCLGGGRDVFAGDIVEMDDREAKWKLQQAWVEPAPEETPAAPPATGTDDSGADSDLTPAGEPSDAPAPGSTRRRR